MEFKKWLSEGIWGQLSYDVPKNKETQLYDFYMLSALLHSPKTSNIPYGGIDEKIEQTTKEIASQLFPKLKKNLLSAVFFAMSAEVRHIFDHHRGEEVYNSIKDKLGDNYAAGFKKYATEYGVSNISSDWTDTPKRYDRRLAGNSDGQGLVHLKYKNSYKSALNSGLSKEEFIDLCLFLFSKMEWEAGYGGQAWANIARGWLKLNDATSLNDMMIWIDHVYDLQHNSDIVFNKVASWAKNNSFRWLKDALDLKAKIKYPHEIWDKVSSTMKQIAAPAMKHYWGKTLEDFENNKNKPLDKYITIASREGMAYVLVLMRKELGFDYRTSYNKLANHHKMIGPFPPEAVLEVSLERQITQTINPLIKTMFAEKSLSPDSLSRKLAEQKNSNQFMLEAIEYYNRSYLPHMFNTVITKPEIKKIGNHYDLLIPNRWDGLGVGVGTYMRFTDGEFERLKETIADNLIRGIREIKSKYPNFLMIPIKNMARFIRDQFKLGYNHSIDLTVDDIKNQ